MALAMIFPKPSKRGKKGRPNPFAGLEFSKQRLSNARLVLRHSRPLAEQVLAGVLKLDAALRKVSPGVRR
jgi:hypothetical protein